jgi:hypothetical protein
MYKFIKGKIGHYILILTSFLFQINAQAVAPSGQYGCVLNRNFGGWEISSAGGSSVASNFTLYIDYTANTYQMVASIQNELWG